MDAPARFFWSWGFEGMRVQGRTACAGLAAALCLLTALGADPAAARARRAHHEPVQAPPAAAAAPIEGGVRLVSADASGYGGLLALPIGGSRVLKFAQPYGRVMVGDPKVADVVPLSDRTLYVLGKAAGASSLTVMSETGGPHPIATLDLRVGFDVEALQRSLKATMPSEPIVASAGGDGLVLDGTVSSSLVAARAVALADRFAPGKVVNLMAVRGPEQVMLSVEVAEVQRSVLRQLGITSLNVGWSNILHTPPNGADGVTPGQLPAVTLDPNVLANIVGLAGIGKDTSIQGLLEALETKGSASILAEPTLVALSGEPAQFFAGGEFPVPVPQMQAGSGTLITIDYKQYGVSVAFTPTVYGDTINLLVAPEVSALDPENSVTLQGFKVPGITTRRAKTTVELRDGQSFAIAGLIRREFTDSLRGLPGAASLPIFGALFRSTGYQNNETEVVIIVTVHLAQPTARKNLLLPTDTRQAPSAAELFLSSTTDKPKAPEAHP